METIQIKTYNMNGKEVGVMDLDKDVFDVEFKEDLIHQAVVTRLANERQGTKSTLTRSEVRGGGKKPWRQKGTGNARQGSTRAPQWIKGGVVFAPKSRDFSKKMNVWAKRIAMLSALSQKIRDDEVLVVEGLKVENGKTKEVVSFLKNFGIESSAIVFLAGNDELFRRASGNIPKLSTMPVELINCYDVVKNVKVIFAKEALEKLQDFYSVGELEEQEAAE